VLFLGLGSRAKGLADTVEAIAALHAQSPGTFRLTFAGNFASAQDEDHFHARASLVGREILHYAGFADETAKRTLFAATDIFCFPTAYPHEGQPLALIEAMAHDRPIVTTRWRGIPGMLPRENIWYVEPGRPEALAVTLTVANHAAAPHGVLRQHYLAYFTRERHLAALRDAVVSLDGK
jgi:glycosyltransferase involved in cell wall biosynthesis